MSKKPLTVTTLKSRDGRIRRLKINDVVVETNGPPIVQNIDGRVMLVVTLVDVGVGSDVDAEQDAIDDRLAEETRKAQAALGIR
jgi:hypothetical protein